MPPHARSRTSGQTVVVRLLPMIRGWEQVTVSRFSADIGLGEKLVTHLPAKSSRWKAGLDIPVNKVLAVRLSSEWPRVRPVLRGEMGMRRKELLGFHLGLCHAAKLGETGG